MVIRWDTGRRSGRDSHLPPQLRMRRVLEEARRMPPTKEAQWRLAPLGQGQQVGLVNAAVPLGGALGTPETRRMALTGDPLDQAPHRLGRQLRLRTGLSRRRPWGMGLESGTFMDPTS